jgi:hypothetical protein
MRSYQCALLTAFILGIDDSGQAQPADCSLECNGLTSRLALAVEYDLCGETDLLRTARDEKRVVGESSGVKQLDKLHSGGKCLRERFTVDGKPSPVVTVFVLPIGSEGLHTQAPSANLSVFRACLDKLGVGGARFQAHRDLSSQAVTSLGWPKAGAFFLLASEQADAYEWGRPAAHAQANENEDYPAARKEILGFAKKRVDAIRAACCEAGGANLEGASYNLGYLMHLVQDLATHHGMTNTYHSWLIHNGDNPDIERTHIAQAQENSKKALDALGKSPHGQCAKNAAAYSAATVDWDAAARRHGFGAKDGTKKALIEFAMLGLRLTSPPDTRWKQEQVGALFDALIALMTERMARPCSP